MGLINFGNGEVPKTFRWRLFAGLSVNAESIASLKRGDYGHIATYNAARWKEMSLRSRPRR